MKIPTYLLSHGFGFNDSYWDNFIRYLEQHNQAKASANKASINYEFFSEDFKPDNQKEYIGIGHSIGFLKLNNFKLKHPEMNLSALIGLQGFLNLCGSDPEQKKLRQKNLDRMIKIFSKDLLSSLIFFYGICGYPTDKSIPADLSEDKLMEDLELMKSAFEFCSVPTLIIGSQDDVVIDRNILQDNFGKLLDGGSVPTVQLRFINGVGHTLGFSEPKEVFEMIQKFLKDISKE